MRALSSIMIVLFAWLCLGSPVLAQEDAPATHPPEAQDQPRLFVASDGQFAFLHPPDWEAEEDDPKAFYLTHESDAISILIQVLPNNFPADARPDEALNSQFEGAGYAPPQIIEAPEGLELALMQDEIEGVIGFFLDAEVFVLMFITADEATRASHEDVAGFIAASMAAGEVAVMDLQANTRNLPGVRTEAFDFMNGTLTLDYPRMWSSEVLPELGILFTDADEHFFVALIHDVVEMLEGFGIEGDLERLQNPSEIIRVIDATLFMDDPSANVVLTEYMLAGREVARLSYSDEMDNLAILLFSLAPQTPVIVIMDAGEDDLGALLGLIDTLIETLAYDAG